MRKQIIHPFVYETKSNQTVGELAELNSHSFNNNKSYVSLDKHHDSAHDRWTGLEIRSLPNTKTIGSASQTLVRNKQLIRLFSEHLT